jgi:KAP family P-loop domain
VRKRTRESSKDTEPAAPDVVLLADEPADTDEFDAKAHAAVAETIAGLVRNEPGGKVIGLEGSWGSGKSTVVHLVSKQLGSPRTGGPDMHVLVFDAWAHQGDPLRQTFLESLIGTLRQVGWLQESLADDFRRTLTGKTTHTQTRTTARLSREGKLASAAAVLLPLGAALFANHFSTLHRPAIYVGLAFLLGPLLVVAGFLALKGLGILLGGREEEEKETWEWRLAHLQPFSFFANEQTTDTLTKGVQTSEPTSVQFERIFSDVLKATLSDGRRLLIVLDNLDRVVEKDANSILATMQTFTAAAHGADWGQHVWTLIPYDAVGLDRLWNVGDGQSGVSSLGPHRDP